MEFHEADIRTTGLRGQIQGNQEVNSSAALHKHKHGWPDGGPSNVGAAGFRVVWTSEFRAVFP